MPDFGWSTHAWRGPKIPCTTCGRRIRGGVVNVHDKGNPPSRAMCHPCHRLLMDDPHAFEQAHSG